MSLSSFSRSFSKGHIERKGSLARRFTTPPSDLLDISEDEEVEDEFTFDTTKRLFGHTEHHPLLAHVQQPPDEDLEDIHIYFDKFCLAFAWLFFYCTILSYVFYLFGNVFSNTVVSILTNCILFVIYLGLYIKFLWNDYHTHDLHWLFKIGWLSFTLGYGLYFAISLNTVLGIMSQALRFWLSMVGSLFYTLGSFCFLFYGLKLPSRKIRDATFLGSFFFLLGSVLLSFFTFIDLAEFYGFSLLYMRGHSNDLIDSQLESDVLVFFLTGRVLFIKSSETKYIDYFFKRKDFDDDY